MTNLASFFTLSSVFGSTVFGIYLFFAQHIVSASRIVDLAVEHACHGKKLEESNSLVSSMIRCEPIRQLFDSRGELSVKKLLSSSPKTEQDVRDAFSEFLEQGSEL